MDYVEADGQGNPLAFLETKHFGEPLSDFQRNVIVNLARLATKPAYLVRHDRDCTRFQVSALNALAAQYLEQYGIEQHADLDRRGHQDFLCAIHGNQPTDSDRQATDAYEPPATCSNAQCSCIECNNHKE